MFTAVTNINAWVTMIKAGKFIILLWGCLKYKFSKISWRVNAISVNDHAKDFSYYCFSIYCSISELERTIQKECTYTAIWDKSFNTRPLYYYRRVYCFIIMLVLFSDLCIRFVRYKGNKKSCSFQPLKIISFENQNSILRWLTDEQLIFLFKKIKEKTWLYFSCSDFL